jgi:hypothetical protein
MYMQKNVELEVNCSGDDLHEDYIPASFDEYLMTKRMHHKGHRATTKCKLQSDYEEPDVILFLMQIRYKALRCIIRLSLTHIFFVQIGTTKGTGGDVLILEEAAYCDEGFFYETVAPILSVGTASLVAISTLTSEINFYTRLIKMRDPSTGRPLFTTRCIELVCEKCKEDGKSEDCVSPALFLPYPTRTHCPLPHTRPVTLALRLPSHHQPEGPRNSRADRRGPRTCRPCTVPDASTLAASRTCASLASFFSPNKLCACLSLAPLTTADSDCVFFTPVYLQVHS